MRRCSSFDKLRMNGLVQISDNRSSLSLAKDEEALTSVVSPLNDPPDEGGGGMSRFDPSDSRCVRRPLTERGRGKALPLKKVN